MHFSNSAWTAALLVPSVTAFFPGHPNWEHSNGDGSTVQRRAPFLPVHAQWDHGHGNQPSTFPRTTTTTKRGKSVTFPLRRVAVPARRDYDYKIVDSKDPSQKNSVAVDQDGNDLSYMAAVSFGDSKKEHHLLLDSAATHTWVYGNDCKDKACEEHVQFGKGDSSTLKLIDETWQVGYATGDNLNLTTASDKIHVGSASVDLTFGLVTAATDGMFNFAMDGILGLGRGDNIEMATKTPGFVEVLKSSGVINSKLYGIHYSRASDGLNDGELNFGELNKDRYDGDINYLSTQGASAGLWEVALDDAGVDGKAIGFKSKLAIMDTGTSWIWIPPADAKAFHDLIPGAKGSGSTTVTYTVPCSSKQVIWLQLNGQKYNVSLADWMGPDENNDGLCDSRILGRSYNANNPNQWLVGDTFLKNVYSVYDFDNNQFGLGVKSSQEKPTPTSTLTGGSASPTATGESSSPTSPSSATPSGTGSDPFSPVGTPSNTTNQDPPSQPTGGSGTGGSPGPAGAPGPASGTSGGASPSPTGAAGHLSASVATLGLSIVLAFSSLLI